MPVAITQGRREVKKRPAATSLPRLSSKQRIVAGELCTDPASEVKQPPLRTLIINLEKRPDRWARVSKQYAPFDELGILSVERFGATDGLCVDIPEDMVGLTWTTDRNAMFDNRPNYKAGVELRMSPGERGCAHSHMRAWQVVASGDAPVLILEDDARPTKNFAERLPQIVAATPGDADAVYLGYINGHPWKHTRKIAGGLKEAVYMWTTVAYVLWPKGAKKLLDLLPVDEPLDNFMAWQMFEGRFTVFAVIPMLVHQQESWARNSNVPHSDDAVFAV